MARGLLLAVLVCATTDAVADPAPKGGDRPLYFPTEVGDTAVYETSAGQVRSEYTDRVTKVEKLADGVRVTVETARLGRPAQEYEKVVSPAGLLHTKTAGKVLEPPAPNLRLPAKAGDEWTHAVAKTATRYTVVGEEEVEVPAGKFKALRVKAERADGLLPPGEAWWAPGVGLVKKVLYLPDGAQVVQVLKSFTPAGK